ncbi:MAG: dihydrofolate reductase [Ignavibacteriales bacterium]|nr:MAG: dihydrofolate reductase [Ignavibacteriales bacterium]
MQPERKVFVYIAISLDGYIAKENDDISFLSIVDKPGEDYGYSEFIKDVDTVIIGRKTYDKVLTFGIEFPHKDKRCYVITRTPREPADKLIFYTHSLRDLVLKLKQEEGKNIFVDGGSEIINTLLKQNLVDEFIISVIPVLLGGGIKLFRDGRPGMNLKLIGSKEFDTGLIQLHYRKISDQQ